MRTISITFILWVIIVGAGVSGLTLAHAFHKADIDYVVLDKHAVAPACGSSISMYTNGGRILDQLGLYDVLVAKKAEMQAYDGWVWYIAQRWILP
ncbi:hypothetical protein PG994_006727 [Apiospora phragmitis]|uniref:FAD-binding domain-containing protein n=1 Tax=Apiospora phragmitis TaxID=2905665 RepID=A0ABR1VFV6_9PEZI